MILNDYPDLFLIFITLRIKIFINHTYKHDLKKYHVVRHFGYNFFYLIKKYYFNYKNFFNKYKIKKMKNFNY